ncbi:MAG: phosphate/phosphite/phosphonate ABC transporter substrate-binding protein [Thermodesulfobacteriota bacterium]
MDFGQTVPASKPEKADEGGQGLRVAVAAMISPKETEIYYRQLLDYAGLRLGREIHLVQRRTYGEISTLLSQGRIDAAFVCSGPYAVSRDQLEIALLAVPVVRGSQMYHSYLIVGRDSPYQSLNDLRDKTFAFTDPDSNTGRLVPLAWLKEIGERPETFFQQTIFTYSHDNSILAVARGLVDGAAVDSLIWEFLHHRNPELTRRTRVIKRSEPFGMPPVVASNRLAPEWRDKFQETLLTMHESLAGRKVLNGLLVDRFIQGSDTLYDSIRRLKERLNGGF